MGYHIISNLLGISPDTDPSHAEAFCAAWSEMVRQHGSGGTCPQGLIAWAVGVVDQMGLRVVGVIVTLPDGTTLSRGEKNIDPATWTMVGQTISDGWRVTIWSPPDGSNFYDDPNVKQIRLCVACQAQANMTVAWLFINTRCLE
jgi:hypothetical protein